MFYNTLNLCLFIINNRYYNNTKSQNKKENSNIYFKT